jgi:hypothetical protein
MYGEYEEGGGGGGGGGRLFLKRPEKRDLFATT